MRLSTKCVILLSFPEAYRLSSIFFVIWGENASLANEWTSVLLPLPITLFPGAPGLDWW